MPPEIRFSTRALKDLEEAVDALWAYSPARADRFAYAWASRIEQILEFPESGRRENDTLRSILVDPSGYRLIYAYDGAVIRIVGLRNVRRERPF